MRQGVPLVTLLFAALGTCWPSRSDSAETHGRELRSRGIVGDPSQLKDTYDFIIAGGGTAGLVLASRLSEDSNHTVLVLEAGDTGYAVNDSIDVPSHAFTQSLLGTSYDWAYNTIAQPNANNRQLSWPRGKVLGGSSAVNGLYLVRPSQLEYDTWASMMSSQDGGKGANAWNWESQFTAFKKTETFTPPSPSIQPTVNIQFSSSSHGTNGPLHASYPGFMLPAVGEWLPTLQNIGLSSNPDSSSGQSWGGFVATSSINPDTWTRSHARAAYIDPLPPRSNLDILPLATVTRIVFDSNSTANNLTATGVEFAMGRGGPKTIIKVRKEVIVSGGAIGSPNILMHSGVGPSDVLTAAGVNVVLNLPGVGQHMQDHISTQVTYQTNAMTFASYAQQGQGGGVPAGQSSPFLSFINSATCYANLTSLFGDYPSASSFQQSVVSALNSSATSLVPSKDSTVINGYKAIYTATAEKFLLSSLGHVELLLYATGSSGSQQQTISIQVALQHPFSHGRLYITSNDPFNDPIIDPQYLSHFADATLMRQGLKLARKIGQTAPLNSIFTGEVTPGPGVNSDQEWDNYAANSFGTEFHPANTMAMLPLAQGGVVDANLKVYGLSNVRIVDASVFPIQFAAHLQWPVYALAEQASTIIRAYHNLPVLTGPPSSTTSISSAPTFIRSSDAISLHCQRDTLTAIFLMFMLAFTLIVKM